MTEKVHVTRRYKCGHVDTFWAPLPLWEGRKTESLSVMVCPDCAAPRRPLSVVRPVRDETED